jgi:hypothetical protein
VPASTDGNHEGAWRKTDALAYAEVGTPFNPGMVLPVPTHTYELRYWLAAGRINPGLYGPDDVSGQIGRDVFDPTV